MPNSIKSSAPDDDRVEQLARELADRLRLLPNRQELTDYAVSILRESNEEADQEEVARESIARAARNDPFNPIAFAIPVFIIGAVLCVTGLLTGPGLVIIGIALIMVVYGLFVAAFGGPIRRLFGRRTAKSAASSNST